jgi:hypothetical protein
MRWLWICCCTTLLSLAGCAPMRAIDLTPDHPAHPQATEAPLIVRDQVLRPDPELVQPVPPAPRAVDHQAPHDHPQQDHKHQHEHHPPAAPSEPHPHPEQQDEPLPHQHGAERGRHGSNGDSPIRPGEDPQ